MIFAFPRSDLLQSRDPCHLSSKFKYSFSLHLPRISTSFPADPSSNSSMMVASRESHLFYYSNFFFILFYFIGQFSLICVLFIYRSIYHSKGWYYFVLLILLLFFSFHESYKILNDKFHFLITGAKRIFYSLENLCLLLVTFFIFYKSLQFYFMFLQFTKETSQVHRWYILILKNNRLPNMV